MSKKRRGSNGDDGIIKGSGVNYQEILDHRIDDSRHERQKASKAKELQEGLSLSNSTSRNVVSSTFDAFQRMITRKEGRKIADKIADPTRPTWEEYKRVNEDKLDMVGQEIRKMTEYRAELDRERDLKLAERREKKRKLFASDSEDSVDEEEEEEEGNGHDEGNDKKKKKKTKKLKKEKKKKEKKSKKKRKKRSSHTSSSSDSGEDYRETKRGMESDGGRSEEERNSGSQRERSLSPAPSAESGEIVG